MTPEIRRLTVKDAPAYRTIRLEGLKKAPKAFGESLVEAERHDEDHWQDRLASDTVHFGAFIGDNLVGIVNYRRHTPQKMAHMAWLYGMYVSPAARGTGAGEKLIAAVLDHAREADALQVHLGVGTFNTPALKLYERMGFIRYGTEPRALHIDGEFIDEHHMVRYLDKEE